MRNDRGNTSEYDAGGYPAGSGPPEQPVYGEPYAGTGYSAEPEIRSNKGIIRLIVFLVIVVAALIFVQTGLFRLKTVYVIGNDSIAAEHIVSLSGLKQGDSIFSVSEDTVRNNLEADHWIVLNHLYKQYPNEVYLFVKEREIVATLQWLGIQYTLDIEGMVLQEYSAMDYDGDLPTVYGFNIASAIAGEYLSVRTNDQLVAYSSIVSELTIQRYADQVVSVNVSDPDQLSLLTDNGITVQLGNKDYMRAKIGAMRTDLAYLQQLGETTGVLDVTVPEDGKFRRE